MTQTVNYENTQIRQGRGLGVARRTWEPKRSPTPLCLAIARPRCVANPLKTRRRCGVVSFGVRSGRLTSPPGGPRSANFASTHSGVCRIACLSPRLGPVGTREAAWRSGKLSRELRIVVELGELADAERACQQFEASPRDGLSFIELLGGIADLSTVAAPPSRACKRRPFGRFQRPERPYRKSGRESPDIRKERPGLLPP